MSQENPRQHKKVCCPECNSSNIIRDFDTGETICGGCGLVLAVKMMDKGPEWRSFTPDEKASRFRVGAPMSYSSHDKGLSTAIGRIDRDAYGRKLPQSTRREMWRLKKWQVRSTVHTSVERNLAEAMGELNRISGNLITPKSIKEKASLIYRKALDKGIIRGRSIAAITAAAIYAAYRTTETPRALVEIATAANIDKKDLGRSYRILLRELDVKAPIQDSREYLKKYGLGGEAEGLGSRILNVAKENRLTGGKGPAGIAAGAAYIASEIYMDGKTQRDIADIAEVTEVTVRNRYKDLIKKLDIIFYL